MKTRKCSLWVVVAAAVLCVEGCYFPAAQEQLLLEAAKKKFKQCDYTGSIRDCSQLITLEPEANWAYYDRGLAESALEDYPAAIRDFTRVLAEDSSDGWAFYQRGLALIYAGDPDDGCSDLRRVMDLGVEESESAMEELCR